MLLAEEIRADIGEIERLNAELIRESDVLLIETMKSIGQTRTVIRKTRDLLNTEESAGGGAVFFFGGLA